MRRPLTFTLLAIALAACGRGDDTATPAATTSPAVSSGAGADEAVPSTVPVGTLECEDEPNPADYVEGQIPPANRPCEIPTALQIHAVRSGTGRYVFYV